MINWSLFITILAFSVLETNAVFAHSPVILGKCILRTEKRTSTSVTMCEFVWHSKMQ